jgi:hypothetical protein
VALRDRGVRREVAVDEADRLHPLIPPEPKRWRDLYRAAVEREFGRLKQTTAWRRSECEGLSESPFSLI